MQDTLEQLYATILSRRDEAGGSSYTASLFAKGRAKIAQKLGEEATETVIAAMEGNRSEVVKESADLLYHWLVLLAEQGIRPDEVMQELAGREGVSGLVEKASR